MNKEFIKFLNEETYIYCKNLNEIKILIGVAHNNNLAIPDEALSRIQKEWNNEKVIFTAHYNPYDDKPYLIWLFEDELPKWFSDDEINKLNIINFCDVFFV